MPHGPVSLVANALMRSLFATKAKASEAAAAAKDQAKEEAAAVKADTAAAMEPREKSKPVATGATGAMSRASTPDSFDESLAKARR